MKKKLLITRRQAGLLLSGATAAVSLPALSSGVLGNMPAPPHQAVIRHKLKVQKITIPLRGRDVGETELWSLDGSVEGPILRANIGEICRITVVNGSPFPLSLHWHGLRNSNAVDGFGGLTQKLIAPGRSYEYVFTPQEVCTCLIRPCVIGHTSELNGRGLTGLLIIEEKKKTPQFDYDLHATISDWLLDGNGLLEPFQPGSPGRLGNLLTVKRSPPSFFYGVVPGKRIRIRLANACNARSMPLLFEHMDAWIVAVDGHPVKAFQPRRQSLPFAPGNRYEIVFDMPDSDEDHIPAITAAIGDNIRLIHFKPDGPKVEKTPEPISTPPNLLLPEEIRLQDAFRFKIDLSVQPGKSGNTISSWAINGISGKKDIPPLFSVKSGTPVVLTIQNGTTYPQPLHIHGHCFRLLHNHDDGWDPFWMDALQIPGNATVKLAFIAGSSGKWAIASTICERFDTGLWGWFQVS